MIEGMWSGERAGVEGWISDPRIDFQYIISLLLLHVHIVLNMINIDFLATQYSFILVHNQYCLTRHVFMDLDTTR